MSADGPHLYTVLAREATERVRQELRETFDEELRQVYRRLGTDVALQKVYAAGVADGFRQGVARASE